MKNNENWQQVGKNDKERKEKKAAVLLIPLRFTF